ncbi:MAG: hypothetical protein ACE37J_15920 [Pikeienuella sp.]|uniref:hypothetical protein n=1 Tax=Pikeienuella sp. TaxID=2831957 RepID=UPI00391B1567
MAFDTNQDRRVKLAFGEFDCEIVGYDDPLRVLDKILGLYVAVAETSPALIAGGAPEAARLRARFAEVLGENAARLGASVSPRGAGVTVSAAPAVEAPPPPEQSATPAHLAGMDPALLAEFAAMRARLKDRDEPAGERIAKPAPTTAEAAPQPRVRIIRAEKAKADDASGAEPAARPATAFSSQARAVSESAAASEAAESETDNFLFAETDDTAAAERPAEPAPVEPAAAAPGKEPDVGRFGFLRRIMPQATAAEEAPLDAEGPFRRLREASEAALPRLDPAARAPEPRLALVRPVRTALSGPAAFAAEAGANGLTEHVEAAAAWLALSEERPRFSRRDVMQALSGIEAAAGYSLEARMKAFRTLLKNGVLVREEDGLYSLSRAARFGHEGRLRA